MKLVKIFGYLLYTTAAIALFVVSMGIVEIVVEYKEISTWFSMLLYFGTGVLISKPITKLFKDIYYEKFD